MSYGSAWYAVGFVASPPSSSFAEGNMTPHQILGVNEHATQPEIDSAYEDRVKRYDPESGGDAWAVQQVQAAYDALRMERVKVSTDSSGLRAKWKSALLGMLFVLPLQHSPWTGRTKIAVGVALAALLFSLFYWNLLWRIVAIACSAGFTGLAVWLVFLSRFEYRLRSQYIAGCVAAGCAAVLFFGLAVFAGGNPSISADYLELSAPTIVVSIDEREIGELALHGSSLIREADQDSIRLYTNAHVLGLQEVANQAVVQRDRTANISGFSLAVQFPSGKRKAARRIALARIIHASRNEMASGCI